MKSRLTLIPSLFALVLSAQTAVAQNCDCPPLNERPMVTITDAGSGIGTDTWTCDNTYLLDGYVFIASGQSLTIEAGTVVKGMEGSGSDAAALIVSRGGQIFADGNETCPITFTFEADELDGSVAYSTRGQWGGLIVCGNAPNNLPTGEGQVEGIPSDNDQAAYGGTDPADNSGSLTYVSIRHGGTQLGAANEINGLTLASVGNQTTIHHIEVVSNDDDGIEFFGGTVNVRYAAVLFSGDDSFDYDQGWNGNGQFWFSLNDLPLGDRAGEFDGDDSPNVSSDGMPFATPTLLNVTAIGRGASAGRTGFLFRAGAGGYFHHSIIEGFETGIELEDVQEPSDAYDKLQSGLLALNKVIISGAETVIHYDGAETDGQSILDTYATEHGVIAGTPGMDGLFSFDNSGVQVVDCLDPRPSEDVSIDTTEFPFDAWFQTAGYHGAFEGDSNWLNRPWSYAYQVGLFDCGTSSTPEATELEELVFPNPFTSILNITWNDEAPCALQLVDLSGRLAWEGVAQSGVNTIIIESSVPAGIYILSAQNAQSSWRQTLIKTQ
jgi:hypothetical protein